MYLTIEKLNPLSGDSEVVGTLTLVKGTVVVDPGDSVTLQHIVEKAWYAEVDGRRVTLDAAKDPEAFLAHLSLVLKSPYLSASVVQP